MRTIYAGNNGFTLIELLFAIGLTAIISVTAFGVMQTQDRSFNVQEQTVAMHQNLRAAMELMQRDLRATGFDPLISDSFGIVSVQNRDGNVLDPNGQGSIRITADFDSDGTVGAGETITYAIYDSPVASPDGISDLGRNIGGGLQMLGEGVERLAFAYAYANDDGTLVMNTNVPAGGGAEPLWAFDSNNDNLLDRALDTNNDGLVDTNDDPNGAPLDPLISGATTVPTSRIRSVKIWMLGRALQPDLEYSVTALQYKVGNQVFNHPNDNIRRQVLTSVVKFRNMGL